MNEIVVSLIDQPDEARLRAIVGLYRQAGWWPEGEGEDLERLAGLVRQSHCFAAALAPDGSLIGMGRAISDGVSDAYLQDVTVAPAWRRSGLASRIVGLLVERLRADGISWIALIAAPDTTALYRRLGFSEMAASTPMLLAP